jgi:3-mercaptopyruvate sulfurtransferase SseA
VLKLLGYDRVRNYDGSMREWANRADTPLVV